MSNTQFDSELDCQGLNCPLPILKTKKAMDGLTSGQILKMMANEPQRSTIQHTQFATIKNLKLSLLHWSVSLNRDLHCWELSLNWTPGGIGQGVYVRLNVKSPSLKDLNTTMGTHSFLGGDGIYLFCYIFPSCPAF